MTARARGGPSGAFTQVTPEMLEHTRIDVGLLGRFFGSATTAPTNIAGVVVVALITAVIASGVAGGSGNALEFAKLVTPVITLVLGYLFGKRV